MSDKPQFVVAREQPQPVQHPRIIEGGLAIDDRGVCWFANEFNPQELGIRRFYVLANHGVGFIRAWHGHKTEAKYVYVARGSAVIGAVMLDHWEYPSHECEAHRHVLSAWKPQILYIPPMYANGFMALEPQTMVFEFSTTTLEESKGDDHRWKPDYFKFQWHAIER